MCLQVCRVAYADPLFSASLKAEMANYPELPALAPRDGEADPPEKLFGNRRKGYFKCKSLCRVWTLITFRWLRKRGEFFVVWTDPSSGTSFDGRFVLAHAFTIKYISLHQPGLSVVFKRDGALKSTSVHFQKIRRYVCSYMCVHICVVVDICVHMMQVRVGEPQQPRAECARHVPADVCKQEVCHRSVESVTNVAVRV